MLKYLRTLLYRRGSLYRRGPFYRRDSLYRRALLYRRGPLYRGGLPYPVRPVVRCPALTRLVTEKNKMYLLTKNLKTKKISKKLNHVKVGLFFIKQQKKSVNYELNLFSNIKIHSIFYVSLLKSANPKTFIQNIFYVQYKNENKYEIEKILAQNDQKYFIKWKN